MRPQPGAIVDFYSEGELIAGVILAEEKGRLRVVTETGREDRLAPGRVLAVYEGNPKLAAPPASKTDPSRTDAAKALAGAHARAARERRAGIDLEVVWDLLVDDGSARGLDELAELASGEKSDAARAAVLRGLLEEKVHFTRRAELWEPRPRSAVEEILRQREQEKRRAEERARFVRTARAALAGGGPFARAGEIEEGRLLAALEEVAVQANNASAAAFRDAEWACTELGVRGPTPEYAAFAALRGLGLFSEDENIFIRRYGLQVAFPDGANELSRRAIEEALGRAQRRRIGARGDGIPGRRGRAGLPAGRDRARGPRGAAARARGRARPGRAPRSHAPRPFLGGRRADVGDRRRALDRAGGRGAVARRDPHRGSRLLREARKRPRRPRGLARGHLLPAGPARADAPLRARGGGLEPPARQPPSRDLVLRDGGRRGAPARHRDRPLGDPLAHPRDLRAGRRGGPRRRAGPGGARGRAGRNDDRPAPTRCTGSRPASKPGGSPWGRTSSAPPRSTSPFRPTG